MFSGKKGSEFGTLELIIELIIAAGIIILAISWVNSEVGDSAFDKEFYSKEAGLLMDGITGAPGDVNFEYDATSDFDLQIYFEPGKVSVYDESDEPREQRVGISTLYALSDRAEEPEEMVSVQSFNITKNDSRIEVSDG